MAQIKRRDLVNIVVQPVRKQQVTMAAPGRTRRQGRIVLREIVKRDFRLQTRIIIPVKFTCKGQRVIFRVPGYKGQPLVPARHQISAGCLRFSKQFEIGVVAYKLAGKIRIARMRRQKIVIKAARQQSVRMQDLMFIDA